MLHRTRDRLRVSEVRCRGLPPSREGVRCTLVLRDESGKEGEKLKTPMCLPRARRADDSSTLSLAWYGLFIFGEEFSVFPQAEELQVKVKREGRKKQKDTTQK